MWIKLSVWAPLCQEESEVRRRLLNQQYDLSWVKQQENLDRQVHLLIWSAMRPK